MVDDVHVGVVGDGVVVKTILDELESRQSHPVERKVIGASGVAARDRRRP